MDSTIRPSGSEERAALPWVPDAGARLPSGHRHNDAASALADSQLSSASLSARFGAWRVLGKLGEGGMGKVLLARRADLRDSRLVAIKTMRGSKAPRAAALAAFAAEKLALSRLEHPNIARLYDAGEDADGQPYFVLEHVAG